MARAALLHLVFGLAVTGLVSGCVETTAKDGAGIEGAKAAPSLTAGSAKKGADVEAPEVFQATDSALWDGRPSLGGIWVASPEVTNPERVVMVNPATGKSVTGALFRRERENPGPRLQLSSDAADALGILAGQPTEISVTALRKQEVAVEEVAAPAPTEAAAAATTGDSAEPPAAEATPAEAGEAAAIASAALDAVDAGDAAGADASGATDGSIDPAAAVAAGAALAPDEPPKRKTWKERRAEAKAARDAKKKAAAEAKAAAAAAKAGEAVVADESATADTGAIATTEIETAPLDARNPDASTVGKEAEAAAETPKRKKVVAATEAAPEVAPVAEAVPDPKPDAASGAGGRPIQVASFSKEDNAKRAAEALAKIDITATPQKSERDGKAVWGVVVTGDDAMLKRIKDAGFADAYFLK